ncbi:flagellar biosynthetic protein FliO [Clostridium culturomicium]|uniref:flagellar biosynthetic protein FliO n=1 Tax=Clostridium culturomicium TaxID=1499683 RepID=UPI00058BA49D|nr:flagellar biosynthetic protein FliO [Clostridium culturomicium]
MDKTLMEYLINIILLVPIVLCLIVVSLKLSKKGVDTFSMKSYAQVIERFSLNKDTTLYVLKLGTTGCVLISSAHNTQIIKELDENEIEEVIRMKKEKQTVINLSKLPGFDVKSLVNKGIVRGKEDGHTKGNFS